MKKFSLPPITPFDELTSPRQLQLIKLLLPYTPAAGQRITGIFIRFLELQHTLESFRGFPKTVQASDSCDSPPAQHILEDFRPYLSDGECSQIDQMMQIMQMMEVFQTMQAGNDGGSPADLLMGMLGPEQKEMFETYNAMFSDTMNQTEMQRKEGGNNNERMDE